MFMHTNVCTVWESNPRPLRYRRVFGPLRQSVVNDWNHLFLKFFDQIVQVLEKCQVNSTRNQRACMRNLMTVEEAKGVCEDRSKWKEVFSAYPKGKRTWYNVCMWIKITLISSSWSSSAHYSPLLDKGHSNFSPSRSIFGYSCPAQIVTPPGLRASYTTFTETRSPLQNSFTPAVVGSTADIASPLPLQHANTVCYVGGFSFLSDCLWY
jgi:hypothetical protein